MAEISQVQFTLTYEDDTNQKITMGPLSSSASALQELKANVMEFNDTFTSDTARLSLSKYGALWRGITAVSITTTDKRILF